MPPSSESREAITAEQIELMAEISQAALSAGSYEEAMDRTVSGLVESLGYFCASVGLIDPGARTVRNAAWCARSHMEVPPGYRQEIDRGIIGRAIRSRRPVVVQDTAHEPDYVAVFDAVHSEICIPLVVGDEVIGILDVNSERTAAFSDNDRRLLECLAGQLAQVFEKQRLLREVLETRDYLEGLVEAAGDAIITTDLEGRIQRWNPAAERMFGCPKERMLGNPVSTLWPSEETEEGKRLFRQVVRGEGIQQRQVRRLRTDGTAIDVLLTLSPIHDAAGNVVAVSSIVRDVSERVRMESRFVEMHRKVAASEEKYRRLVQHNQEAIFLLSPVDLSIRETNPCAARLAGRSPEGLTGLSWNELVLPEESAGARDYLQRAARGRAAPPREVRMQSTDGRRRILEITASAVRVAEESYLQVIGRDVTERRQAEVEREALRHRLMQSEKLSVMGELLSGVAHELNNPLTGVIGYAQLLSSQPCQEGLRRNLDRIQEEARRCHRIVQNLLGFARQRRTERSRVDVNQVVDQTLDLRSYQMRVDNIWVVKDLHPDVPPVEGDSHQLQQVFMNLITNAHQALASTGKGGVLTVTTRPRRGTIEVRFADNGPGIPDRIRAKIFDPFFTTKGVGHGTGLGLSICHGIVQDHRGRLSVSSQPGVETTFVVELPTGEAGSLRAAETRPDEKGSDAPEEVRERARRVLVVDDEDSIREFLGEALRSRGHEVDTVANGLLALDRMREAPYDAVITDLKMPGMNGRQLYEELASGRPEVASRIIFATGDLVASDTMEFLKSTGNPYLEKPFSIRSIARALDSLEGE